MKWKVKENFVNWKRYCCWQPGTARRGAPIQVSCHRQLSRFIKDPEFAPKRSLPSSLRFQLLEGYAREENLDLAELSLDDLNLLWDRAKDHLRKKPQA